MRLKISQFLLSLVLINALMLGGCSIQQIASNAYSAISMATTEATSVSQAGSESIPGITDLPRLEGKATVVVTVNGSPITIEVDGTDAPITAGNFVDLVQKGMRQLQLATS